jgi:hypothetical protein
MIRAGVHEKTENKICHFYSGLRIKIQDIVDYEEYDIVNHLFQLAMLPKKELLTMRNGRSNKYILVHKGKKITLFPLTSNEIVQCNRTIAETAKRESKIQHD